MVETLNSGRAKNRSFGAIYAITHTLLALWGPAVAREVGPVASFALGNSETLAGLRGSAAPLHAAIAPASFSNAGSGPTKEPR